MTHHYVALSRPIGTHPYDSPYESPLCCFVPSNRYPLLFSGYNTFKRPPFAELEVYRACFEVLSKFLWKRQLDHTDMAADENVRESFDIPVLDIDGKRVKLHRSVQHTASQLRVPCVCVCVCVCLRH